MQHRFYWLTVALVLLGSGYGLAQYSDDGFFDNTPVFQVVEVGPEWRYKDMVLEQSTGDVVIVWEHVSASGTPTGTYSFHWRRDTKLGKCLNPQIGLGAPCTSGMVIP